MVKANNSFVSGSAFRGIVPQTIPPFGRFCVMDYRYLTPTVGGFLQQLAVCYVGRGYFFYVQGTIPKNKSPEEVDKNILAKYKIPASKFQRYRRKRWGIANLQYLRWENHFIILATHGIHVFFEAEVKRIKDVRREPILFEGYSISYQNGPKVRLAKETYENLKSYILGMAVHKQGAYITQEVRQLPYESYAPVRRQLLYILTSVNLRRKAAGLPLISYKSIRYRRNIYKPFAPPPPSPPPTFWLDYRWSRSKERKHRTRKQGSK